MQTDIRAGIDIYGSALRYAEVERRGPQYRLLRLGSCAFDFDLPGVLLREGHPEKHAIVGRALSDVFEGSQAETLHVVLHPPDTHAFQTPVAAGTSAQERNRILSQQAHLLLGEQAEGLHVSETPLFGEQTADGERMEWFRALAMPDQVLTHLRRLVSGLPADQLQLHDSMGAVARALTRLYRIEENAPEEGVQLGIGIYDTHLEFTLCRGPYWIYSLHTPNEAPTNAVFYAAKLFDYLRYDPADVYRLALYGELPGLVPYDMLAELTRCDPAPLNALTSLELAPDHLADDAQVAPFAPCLGATT